MNITEQIDTIAKAVRPVTTINLIKLLAATDKLIVSARKVADQTGDYSDVQAHNLVRTAIIDVMDERDENLFDNYLAQKAVA